MHSGVRKGNKVRLYDDGVYLGTVEATPENVRAIEADTRYRRHPRKALWPPYVTLVVVIVFLGLLSRHLPLESGEVAWLLGVSFLTMFGCMAWVVQLSAWNKSYAVGQSHLYQQMQGQEWERR